MASLTFPPRLPLANTPTPLQKLHRVSESLGVNVWLKRDDLTGSVLSGNKIRKLEFTLAEAQRQGCDSLISCGGLQSNHCRATALLGTQLGFDVHLILRGDSPKEYDGNLLLDAIAGASIETYPQQEFSNHLNQRLEHKAQQLRERGKKPFIIPTGASDDIGCWGYVAACSELQKDFQRVDISPFGIYTATGSGGTQAGLTAGAELFDLGCPVTGIAVCDDEQYFQTKVRHDLNGWSVRYAAEDGFEGLNIDALNIQVLEDYIGPGYAIADDEIYDTIIWLTRLEGVVLDPVYTGKAFHGLKEEILAGRIPPGSDVVFIHTGGIFGLFPDKQRFIDRIAAK